MAAALDERGGRGWRGIGRGGHVIAPTDGCKEARGGCRGAEGAGARRVPWVQEQLHILLC